MTRKKITLFFLLILFLFSGFKTALAQEEVSCDNRYLTLINPVRGRGLWSDQSLKPLKDQYGLVADYGFSATWLLQYDALTDEEIVSFIRENFTDNQEIGLFLEVSLDFAESSRVIYPHGVAWFDPQAVFLSGYSRVERKMLIDRAFSEFKESFGYYPSSVGAWWIDSYSLDYMKKNYGIKTSLIVADQKTTDDYGVWGQWWGLPYYPSKANILIPALGEKDKQDVVVIQWAQRDISRAYDEGTGHSNYSLQANDYTERKLNTSYFEDLIGNYLDCDISVGQITVGLETGMEAVGSFPEYKNQFKVLSNIENLEDVTMDEFSDKYRSIYSLNPEEIILKDDESEWVLTPKERVNEFLEEKIVYKRGSFPDYFVADKSFFLDRRLPINHQESDFFAYPFLIPFVFILGFLLYRKQKLAKYYWSVSLFIIVSFLTTFLGYSKFGWSVYFGSVFKNASIVQFFLGLVSYLFFIPVLKFFSKRVKKTGLLILSFSLSFAIDFVIGILRYIQLGDQRYFGFAWDSLRFVGFRIAPKSFEVVSQDFSSVIANSFLRFDFNMIWGSKIISLIVYPLVHLALGGLIFYSLNKLPRKIRNLLFIALIVFFFLYVRKIIVSPPRAVL